MAEKIDCYQRVEAGKAVRKRKQDMKISAKMDPPKTSTQLNMVQGEASSSGASRNPQKGRRKQRKFKKPRNRKSMACHEERHWIQDCPYMAKLLKTVRDEKKPSKN